MSVYTLKDKLLEFRRKYHLTQYNISELTNISQPTISLIERGEKIPLIYEEKLLLDLMDGKNPKAQKVMNNKKIGNNLKQILKYKGYTESSFARLTGITKRQLIDIENGMIDLTDEYTLWQNKIIVPDGVTEGIAVVEVVDGSPADKAGFKKGDIIVKLADEEVGNLAEFRYELYTHKVGDKLKVEYYRNGKLKTTTITLGKNED